MLRRDSRTKIAPDTAWLNVVSPEWVAHRGQWFSEFIEDATAIKSGYIAATGAHDVQAALSGGKMEIVLLNAFLFPVAELVELAKHYPDTVFVLLNHSSLPYTYFDLPNHFQAIEASLNIDNIIYAVIDDRIPIEHSGMVHLPNAVRIPERQKRTIGNYEFRVLISHRADIVKNLPTQLTAVGLLAKKISRKVRLTIQLNGSQQIPEAAETYLQRAGVDCELGRFVDWKDYPEFLRGFDLALHCSLTESCNLAGLEALLAGVPVVGSSALRYLPRQWQTDTESPTAIANVAKTIYLTHEESRAAARGIGESAARRMNIKAADAVRELYRRAAV